MDSTVNDMSCKCLSYTAAFKLRVVETAEKSGNRNAGREHLVSEQLVQDWRKKKADLKAMPRMQRVGVEPRWPELETKAKEWVLDKRNRHVWYHDAIEIEANSQRYVS